MLISTTTLVTRKRIAEHIRFARHVRITKHGLKWIGSVNVVSGYPQFRVWRNGKWTVINAHKWMWEFIYKKRVPTGYDVHHKCHYRLCLTHLELLPASLNRMIQLRDGKRWKVA